MADTYQRMSSGGNVPDLPVLAKVPEKPRVPNIELEAAFAHETGVPTHKDGSPNWSWFMHENMLCRGLVEGVHPRLLDFERTRMSAMKQNDVQYCVNAIVDPEIQSFSDPKEARERAIKTNDYLAEQCKKTNRFGGWACVSLHDGKAAAEELMRCVTELGFHGVLVNGFQVTEDDNKIIYLDDPSLAPLWEAMVELDVPMYLHPRVSHNRLMYQGHPYLESAMWGFALETGTHALRLVYGGIFDKYPTAQVVIGHMGENIPYMAWRIQHYFEMNPFDCTPQLTLQQYLARNLWITTSGNYDTQALQLAINVMGADRILWSIDYPFENASWAADWIDSCPISEGDKRKICYENAIRFLKLKNLDLELSK